MNGGISVPARRRTLALVAVFGTVTVASLVGAASPAQAASVSAIRAAPGTPSTLSITAHPAHARISPLTNPLDITCNIQQLPPFTQGTTKATATIVADGTVLCTFDSNGFPASVTQIHTQQALQGPDGFDHGSKDLFAFSTDHSSARVTAPGCTHGNWTAFLTVTIEFPPGYSPASTAGGTSGSLNIAQCPGDAPSGCAVVCASGGDGTAQAMKTEDMVAEQAGRKDRFGGRASR